ncbi:MAG: hypothetical protein GC186_19930 [Rhodobacteraceae bacterium]|nr:hypothetical protein [Paracoccaceae bacterium]
MRLSTIFAVTAALVAVAGTAWADTPGPGDYYGHMMGGYGYGPGFFGVGMMILVWAILIGAAVLVARWLMERDRKHGNSALDILKERLARGEIDPAEYEARRKALEP